MQARGTFRHTLKTAYGRDFAGQRAVVRHRTDSIEGLAVQSQRKVPLM